MRDVEQTIRHLQKTQTPHHTSECFQDTKVTSKNQT
nr:MAG TPA: hypothetical protein [Caudoviricetes sp.]